MPPPDRQENDAPEANAPAPDGKTPALASLWDILWEIFLGQALAVPELGALTLAHLRLLYWIRSRTPVTWQEARREFGASPVKTARLMRALLRRRLLERCGDPHDPRIVYLRLSAAGRLLLFRMEAYQRRYCRALLRQLSPEEQVALARSLCLLAPPEDEQRARDKE